MKTDSIYEAKKLAKRFNDAATALLLKRNDPAHKEWGGNFPKESGALRRASMDLTRMLAEMRKG